MLLQKNRLIKKEDFENVHRRGKFFCFGGIALKVRENSLKETRIGFLVGVKFSKKAVERNRTKRQLRGFFRNNLKNIKGGRDIVVLVKKSEKKAEKREIDEMLRKVLAAADLINTSKK